MIIDISTVLKYLTFRYLPISPPIKKQIICAIINNITSTESFLPLKFSMIVPCIFLIQLFTVLLYNIVNTKYKVTKRTHKQTRLAGKFVKSSLTCFSSSFAFQNGSYDIPIFIEILVKISKKMLRTNHIIFNVANDHIIHL